MSHVKFYGLVSVIVEKQCNNGWWDSNHEFLGHITCYILIELFLNRFLEKYIYKKVVFMVI